MRVLILGGSGMLGHKLYQVIADRFETYVTLRRSVQSFTPSNLFDRDRTVGQVAAENFDSIVRAIMVVQPTVVVNCIGIVKQVAAAKDPISSISVNALFPHRLAQLCRTGNARLIHISTDCVFSGRKGCYVEGDIPDAEDLYGRTKLLGEIGDEGGLTLRTSMIGRELEGVHGLIEWFLAQDGRTVRGYRRAVFSGLTTHALAEIIARIIAEHPDLEGIWHVAAEPIDKFALLTLVNRVYGLRVRIEPDETVVVDRSLDAARFRQRTGIVAPEWPVMIGQMYDDPTPYRELRRFDAQR